MESSSENSFAWTNTSNDSLDSDDMAVNDQVNSSSDKKHGKKRKAKEISDTGYNGIEDSDESKINVKIEKDQIDHESPKKKKVKIEPESDHDVPKKKKKNKHSEVNGNINDSQDSYDESHLNLQVKQEEIMSSKKKRKKASMEPEDTENGEESKVKDNSSDVCEEPVKHKKKKKKSKKRHNSEDQDGMEVEYKEELAEAELNKSSSKKSANRSIENSVTENSSLQDESGFDEISAIQCEGDIHTISFNDSQSVVKESKKKNHTLYKSTIVNQFKANNNLDDTSHETHKRIPRISDRLQFEDEDDPMTEYSDIQENKKDKTSAKLQKFINKNEVMKLVSQKLDHNSIFTEDDEVWIVKCPKEIDIQAFSDTNLNLNGKCKIKVGGITFEGNLEESQSDTIAALSMEHDKYEIENLPLCGIINFRKRIPKAHFRDDNIMVNNQTNFIPLPETKCRHPLFGTNYKKAIKVPAVVAERLNTENIIEETVTIDKRKKKKHKKDRKTIENEEVETNSKYAMKTEPSPEVIEKKKKKRKHVEDVDVVDGPAPKKAKRIKHDPESAEAWESEKAIEENLFNF